MELSVIVPTYNARETLQGLLGSLMAQTQSGFEVILVDDCSTDGTPEIAGGYPCKLVRLQENHGPAYCRNAGARSARGDILVFTDSDCRVEHDWIANIDKYFSKNSAEALMGRLVLLPSTFLGDSISALGFPAGGAIGFEKIWKVDKRGFTDSLSTCNFAIKRDIFWKAGGFDETFPFPGGEDTLLAYHLKKLDYRIRYCPDILAYHGARESFRGFLKWQFRRGISSFIFSSKIPDKKFFLSLRMWSTGNIIRNYYKDKKFPLVLFLLATSLIVQLAGFFYAKQSKDYYAGSHH